MPLDVSVAYLVLAHDDPAQLRRLLKRLEHPDAASFVHVDGKADPAPFKSAAADIGQVYLCDPSVRVTWAAFSVVEATLRLVDMALARTTDTCRRFVLLSGADYVIASPTELLRALTVRPDREYIRGFAVLAGDSHQAWKVRGRHFRELATRNSWLRRPLFAFERGLRIFPRQLPSDIIFVSGSQWWALTRNCVAFCLDFARANPSFVRLFKTMFAPDEIFFHTIVHNSPFAAHAGPIEPFNTHVTGSGSLAFYANFHYLPDGLIRTSAEAQAALAERGLRLFARKFSTVHSGEALDLIDEALRSRTKDQHPDSAAARC